MRQGLTLIEVLVAVTLLVIISSVGVAAYRQATRRQIMEAANDKVIASLRLAQANAAAGVMAKAICAGQPLAGWQVTFAATSFQTQGVCGSDVFATRQEAYSPANVVVASPLPMPNPILFRVLSRGTNVGGTTTITLTAFGLTRTVQVTSAGEIK